MDLPQEAARRKLDSVPRLKPIHLHLDAISFLKCEILSKNRPPLRILTFSFPEFYFSGKKANDSPE